jgi:hypothetical protein
LKISPSNGQDKHVTGTSNDATHNSGDEFAEALLARITEARSRLSEAASTADSFAVAEALDELEEALGLAREHGVEVPKAEGVGKNGKRRGAA